MTTPSRRCGRIASGAADTAAIAPGREAASAISSPRLRAAATRVGKSMTPAAWSAVSSPKLWPPTTSGRRFRVASSRRVATLATPIAGWAHSVRTIRFSSAWRAASSNLGRGQTTKDRRSSAVRSASASSHAERAASKVLASASPMRRYCEPCPGKRNATLPGSVPGVNHTPPLCAGAPFLTVADALSSALPGSAPRSTATRTGELGSNPSWVRRARSTGCSARAASMAARTLAVSAPVKTARSVGQTSWRVGRGAGPSYSSQVTWKLLPPNPKLDTEARRGEVGA